MNLTTPIKHVAELQSMRTSEKHCYFFTISFQQDSPQAPVLFVIHQYHIHSVLFPVLGIFRETHSVCDPSVRQTPSQKMTPTILGRRFKAAGRDI